MTKAVSFASNVGLCVVVRVASTLALGSEAYLAYAMYDLPAMLCIVTR